MTRVYTPQLGDSQIADAAADMHSMTGSAAIRPRHRLLTLLLAGSAALTLAACEPGSGPFGASTASGEAVAAKPQTSTRLVDRDIEAPQVFQTVDTALWDGRPSLGGVWVASPQAKDPERVIMRNAANGKFVIGALFRRERENPGPTLQISSDAADALGVLAGQPVKLSVTALRREQTGSAGTSPGAPILDSQEQIASTALAAPPATTAAAANASALPAELPLARVAAPQGATAQASKASAPAKPTAAASAPGKSRAAGTGTGTGTGRSIQIGFFSQEDNAARAQAKLAKAGVSAQLRKESAQGKAYWSVFAKGDAAMLQKVKTAGFADAYMLK